ncbi:MAG: MAPEG family protein, partial [Sphingopyxis sp.]|nr:MAPEG family protein [Sphingopyxis sp.]
MPASLLAPGAVLALWTLIMFAWVAATRFPALKKAGIDLSKAPPGGRGADLETILPRETNWKSHNYTHLLEQPTLFYAVIIFLHLSGGSTDLTRSLAWAYV